jgi:hypothetical protein
MMKSILVFTAACGLHAQTANFQPPGMVHPHPASHTSTMWRPDGQSGTVVGRPFSATEVRRTTQVLSDGTRVENSDTSHFYRDAQGRMRNDSAERAQIFDPVAGYSYTLELKGKTYEKTPRPSSDGPYHMAVMGSLIVSGSGDTPGSKPGGPNTEELSAQMVNGIYCRGSRVTSTIPAGTFGNDRDVKVVNERWYSEDLKVLVKSVNSDPRFGTSTYELTNIVQSPPDASLFRIPTDFSNVQRHGSQE